jgi:hypothetical protein
MTGIPFFSSLRALFLLIITMTLFFFTGYPANPHTLYAGEIYRWVDENGETHYSDTDPGESSSKRQKTKSIYIDDAPTVEKERRDTPQKQKKSEALRTASSKEVIIYTLDT